MKRSPLHRRTALRSRSRRKAREDNAYTVWRAEQLEHRRFCEAILRAPLGTERLIRCSRHATVLHHRRFRSSGGAVISTRNTAALCEPCHEWVHAHPDKGHELGLIVREGDSEWEECGL